MPEKLDTAIRDRLARQRTELANERTLLSYIRTAMGFFIVGVPAVWWLELPGVQVLGVVSLVVGVAFLGVGVWRFFTILSSNSKCNTAGPDGLRCCHANDMLYTREC
jgi:putative membrane protein